MAEVSLYRKYRPHNFDNLVGQDHVKNTLSNALKLDRVAHAYIFSGPRGTGKTSAARLLAKALNCSSLGGGFEPCDSCEMCLEINTGRLIDLVEIDAASNRGIDEVRDLKEKINFAPSRGKCKVYIIDEVHMMTKEAFNALLKTLEEPPEHTYFILATTEIHKIPETIISRCQRFDFRRINAKALMTRLSYIAQKEGIVAEPAALEMITRYVDGGLRDAIGLLEQFTLNGRLEHAHVQAVLGLSSSKLLKDLFEYVVARDTLAAIKLIDELHNQGSDLEQFIHEFLYLLRDKMLESSYKSQFEKVAELIAMIEIFQEAKTRNDIDIPQLPLEIAVIRATGAMPKPVLNEVAIVEMGAKNVEKEKLQQPEKVDDGDLSAKLEFNLETISEKWPRITERVSMPSLRMSLRNGKPGEIKGSELVLEFGNSFHMEKVMDHESRIELERIIKDLFNHEIKLTGRLKELELKPIIEDEPARKRDLTDEALEIFGGEVMED